MGPEARLWWRPERPHHLERRPVARGARRNLAGTAADGVSMRIKSRPFLCAFAAAIAVTASFSAAHTATMAAATAKIDADGHVYLRLTFDALAYALNDTPARVPNEPMDELLDGPPDVLNQQLSDA